MNVKNSNSQRTREKPTPECRNHKQQHHHYYKSRLSCYSQHNRFIKNCLLFFASLISPIDHSEVTCKTAMYSIHDPTPTPSLIEYPTNSFSSFGCFLPCPRGLQRGAGQRPSTTKTFLNLQPHQCDDLNKHVVALSSLSSFHLFSEFLLTLSGWTSAVRH